MAVREDNAQPGCAGADEERRWRRLSGPGSCIPRVLPPGERSLAGPHPAAAPEALRGREGAVQGGHGCCCAQVQREGGHGQSSTSVMEWLPRTGARQT